MFMNTQKQSNRQPRNSSANIDVVISWGAARKNRVQKEKKKKTARPEEAKERLWAMLTKGSFVYL